MEASPLTVLFTPPTPGSSAATMLIFILPAAFYLRLVKSVSSRSPQKIGPELHKRLARAQNKRRQRAPNATGQR
ncbi:unnamed protein product [Menidia menidia]|uniref:(Atlantic silverside) hypothetical protein n=1 Tax=Menidia menidia TaxID=238744 RepID=A0A8S4AZT0_9TELE|nr:unnamed protein product [Menidia menidia]